MLLLNTLVLFGPCFASVSCCRKKQQNVDPILDSLGCLEHSTLLGNLSSHSGSSLQINLSSNLFRGPSHAPVHVRDHQRWPVQRFWRGGGGGLEWRARVWVPA